MEVLSPVDGSPRYRVFRAPGYIRDYYEEQLVASRPPRAPTHCWRPRSTAPPATLASSPPKFPANVAISTSTDQPWSPPSGTAQAPSSAKTARGRETEGDEAFRKRRRHGSGAAPWYRGTVMRHAR